MSTELILLLLRLSPACVVARWFSVVVMSDYRSAVVQSKPAAALTGGDRATLVQRHYMPPARATRCYQLKSGALSNQ